MREVLWLVWGPIPVPTGKLLSTAIAFYIHREIRGRRDELVTNLQGYLKVGNVNPQAVNFSINFYLYRFSAGIRDFSYVSRPMYTISFLSTFIVPNFYT